MTETDLANLLKTSKKPPAEALNHDHHADDLVGGTVAPLHFELAFPVRSCRKLVYLLDVPLAPFGTLVLLFVKRSFCEDSPFLQHPHPN
jgi:hypothetical protein